MRRGIHQHECVTCRQPFACGGHLESNYDGWPEVVCSAYHVRGESECEDCQAAPRCDYCGGRTLNQDHSQCLEDMAVAR
jgi:hypothetical protein